MQKMKKLFAQKNKKKSPLPSSPLLSCKIKLSVWSTEKRASELRFLLFISYPVSLRISGYTSIISISTGLLRNNHRHRPSPLLSSAAANRRRPSGTTTATTTTTARLGRPVGGARRLVVRGCAGGDDAGERAAAERKRRSFLTLEEAGLIEVSGLSTHERFLCRLTISSLNLLRVVAEQEGCAIEELNAGRVCDWFLKDKLKREQSPESAVLQWDDSEFQL